MIKRIGIYSGSFDPVHKGHIAFALTAIKAGKLDEVYFAPEIKPRRRDHVAHVAHRISMIKLAIRPHAKLKVLELPDANFSANRTLPRLQKEFPDSLLVLLVGSDLYENMPSWANLDFLLKEMEIVVGLRKGADEEKIKQIQKKIPAIVFDSHEPELSSGRVRKALALSQSTKDILASVQSYIKQHWLYHDISKSKKKP